MDFFLSEFSFCVYNIRYEEKIYDDSIPNYTDYDYTLYFLKYRCVLYQLFFLLQKCKTKYDPHRGVLSDIARLLH